MGRPVELTELNDALTGFTPKQQAAVLKTLFASAVRKRPNPTALCVLAKWRGQPWQERPH